METDVKPTYTLAELERRAMAILAISKAGTILERLHAKDLGDDLMKQQALYELRCAHKYVEDLCQADCEGNCEGN